MTSSWRHTSHELRFFRERPRFLEKKADIPFCRVTPEERRDSSLKLQPILYRRNFSRFGHEHCQEGGRSVEEAGVVVDGELDCCSVEGKCLMA
jgi:hypothetical protein